MVAYVTWSQLPSLASQAILRGRDVRFLRAHVGHLPARPALGDMFIELPALAAIWAADESRLQMGGVRKGSGPC